MGNIRNDLRYNIPIQKQNEIARRYTQQPRIAQTNLNRTNMPKRDIKKHPTTSNKKYKGNIKAKIAVILASLTLLTGAGAVIGINEHTDRLNEMYSYDLQSASYSRPELHNVLANTDLDEILNEYLADPTKNNKEELLAKLEGRDEELAELNVKLIEASFADSLGIPKDDVSIKVSVKHRDNKDGENILNGYAPYRGHTLRITTEEMPKIIEASKNVVNGTADYKYISKDSFDLISDAKFNYVAPNSSYFENNKGSRIERGIKTYKEIKEIINEKDFTIHNGRVFIESNQQDIER